MYTLVHLFGSCHNLASVTLWAPASTTDYYQDHYIPRLRTSSPSISVEALSIFNLTNRLERDDTVGPYRKSLLYLVSRAFEEEKREKILGMQRYAQDLDPHSSVAFIVSKGRNGNEDRSTSETHGGFDNDVATMNSILRLVLGRSPSRPFTRNDLDY